MNEDPPRYLGAGNDTPTSAGDRVSLIGALHLGFQPLDVCDILDPAVEIRLDRAKLHEAMTVAINTDVSGNDEVDAVGVPAIHLSDMPGADVL